jgi:MinD superfamily P-loop ATPase
MVFAELCHGCGGCARVCPEKAISEVGRPIGVVETGLAGDIAFAHGLLNIGETSPTQLIRAVQGHSMAHSTILVDAPPGTSCAAMAAVRGCDRVALVAEPTAFGLHDLSLAVEMAQAIEMPVGVVINRSGMGDDRVDRFCASNGLPIWGRIPHDRRIAEACSRGEIAVDTLPELFPIFLALADVLVAEAHA